MFVLIGNHHQSFGWYIIVQDQSYSNLNFIGEEIYDASS